MTPTYLSAPGPDAELVEGFERIRIELDVPQRFGAAAIGEADRAAALHDHPTVDATHIDFVTIDPEGSMDLDQAVFIERRSNGYRVHYAIADVPGFVVAGGALDAEVRMRALTLYSPDRKVPLHPPVLSEDFASLLPDTLRPALVWRIDLDEQAALVDAEVTRCLIRSRAKLSYVGVQKSLDDGSADAPLQLLREVGELLQAQERQRGGVSLPGMEQEVVSDSQGYRLEMRTPLPVEGWNAQISLLTGRAAARIMLQAGVGILRTMPAPSAEDIDRVKAVARALHIEWSPDESYAEVISRMDPRIPAQAALLNACPVLLRGAGYTPFHGELPALTTHSAVADSYAHVTAPLRRLVDRWGLQICLSVSAGSQVPDWVLDSVDSIPEHMTTGRRRARALERANVDLVEAFVLRDSVGETFEAVVLDSGKGRSLIQLEEPAVIAHADGELELGRRVQVRLVRVDLDERLVQFVPADQG